MVVDVVDGGQDPLFQFLFGDDADVPQHGSRKLGKEAFDQVEPGAVPGREGEGEAASGCLASQALVSFEM